MKGAQPRSRNGQLDPTRLEPARPDPGGAARHPRDNGAHEHVTDPITAHRVPSIAIPQAHSTTAHGDSRDTTTVVHRDHSQILTRPQRRAQRTSNTHGSQSKSQHSTHSSQQSETSRATRIRLRDREMRGMNHAAFAHRSALRERVPRAHQPPSSLRCSTPAGEGRSFEVVLRGSR